MRTGRSIANRLALVALGTTHRNCSLGLGAQTRRRGLLFWARFGQGAQHRSQPAMLGRTELTPTRKSAAQAPRRNNLQVPLIMDRANKGNGTRRLAQALGLEPVVPPLRTRVDPWTYDTDLYKRRNEIERHPPHQTLPARVHPLREDRPHVRRVHHRRAERRSHSTVLTDPSRARTAPTGRGDGAGDPHVSPSPDLPRPGFAERCLPV